MVMSIKVMSFNLRVRVEADGANFFDLRCPKILSMLEAESPDVIGFQEINEFMYEWLENHLKDYVLVGYGREKGYAGESNPIAYKRDRFLLHGFRQETLSPVPQVVGSRWKGLDQSGCPRIYCCAELIDRESKAAFAFFNTHLDHKGGQAQVAETALLCDRITACGLPFVLTGDFNALPEGDAIKMILATKEYLGTTDATSEIGGTFHGYSMDRINEGKMAKIDYIFTNLSNDPASSYLVADDDSAGNFYSDHSAVCAYVSFNTSESENE